jgi:carbonic anhydrase/acetyltransferase-like protein (isoleucine patch superfamily)
MLYDLPGFGIETQGDAYYVAPQAVVIGRVRLGRDASIWFNAVVRGDSEAIVIGDCSNVQDGAVLHADPGSPLILAEEVTIGHMAMVHGCRIGRRSLVGIGSVILNDAVIGERCLVGARSLITEGKKFPDGVLIVGAPARVVRELTEQEMSRLALTAEHYVENGRRYRRELALRRPDREAE